MAKVLADSWRPQIGAHGIIVDGVGKFLFLADQDIGKGSDLQCTAMCCALEAESGLFSLSAAPHDYGQSVFVESSDYFMFDAPLLVWWLPSAWLIVAWACHCIFVASLTMPHRRAKTIPS